MVKVTKAIITTLDDIEGHEGLVTGTHEDTLLRITAPEMEQLAVIFDDMKEQKVIFLYVLDSLPEYRMDTIRQRLKKMNYTVKKEIPCEGAVIRALYFQKKETNQEEKLDENEVQNRIDTLIKRAVAEEASDIFLLIAEKEAYIQMKIHGMTVQVADSSPVEAKEIARVLYDVMGAEDSKETMFNEKRYQQTSIIRTYKGQNVKIRFQSLPIYPSGFEIALRILPDKEDKVKGHISLIDLGYSQDQEQEILDMASKPNGVTIFSGPVGSGKTTTIKHIIEKIIQEKPGLKIRSVEDPPEYIIGGMKSVSQTPVVVGDKNESSPYVATIKAVMRAAFDIMVIGEVRDADTAELLKLIAESGHQVYSTIHAGSALGVVKRLRGLNISNNDLSNKDFLTGMVYQKLVPTLCQDCKILFSKSDANAKLQHRVEFIIGRADGIYAKGPGCDHCTNGITGRTVCAEVVTPDLKLFSLIANNDDIGMYRYWINEMNGKPAILQAIEKIKKGQLSPADVEIAFGPLTQKWEIA